MEFWNNGVLEYWKRGRQRRSRFQLFAIPQIQKSNTPVLHSPGFTLIELLVALALLGILGSSLAGVLRNASDSVNQATASMDNMTRLRSLDFLLGGALNDAVDVELSSTEQKMLAEDGAYDSEEGTFRFRGESQSFGFCLERPFLSAERDGYLHWIVFDVIEDEESGRFSLWLKDVSFIPEIDNPVGDDWGPLGAPAEEWLPVQTVRLLDDLEDVSFSFWSLAEDDTTEEFEEMDPDEIAGEYARQLPDRIVLDLKLPNSPAETLSFDYNLREDLL